MKKSKAKRSIVETAQKLIEKKGYSDLTVNEIAYVAKVSVGTLYYHFPKGKADILADIMSIRLEGYVEKFSQQLSDDDVIEAGMSLEKTLRVVFKNVLENRKGDRPFLVAIQSEMLSNPDEYEEFLKKYQSSTSLQQAMGTLSDFILKSKTIDVNKLVEKQDLILKLIGFLITNQVIFPGYFGKDDDLVDLALSIFLEILKA